MPEYRRVPTAWKKDQLSSLFAAVESLTGTIGHSMERDWWQALLATMWDTGLRIGALMKAEWGDADDGYLLIRAETQKDKEEQRFKLHPDTVKAIARLGKKTGRIFKWPYCWETLWNRYDKLLQKAGLPHGRRDKFHRIRRSVASWFEAAGGNATELLGHSDRRVTTLYLDQSITGKPQASDVLFRPNGEKPAA
jgi:integrase